jgi:hypothetical protein
MPMLKKVTRVKPTRTCANTRQTTLIGMEGHTVIDSVEGLETPEGPSSRSFLRRTSTADKADCLTAHKHRKWERKLS